MRAYEYRHIVGFEETNLVGNVYYLNHLGWQGRCRELFLREYASEVVTALQQGLAIVTTRCACEYLEELTVFDEIIVRMGIESILQNRVTMKFEYWRKKGASEQLVARGEQQVAFMQREKDQLLAVPIPDTLLSAFRLYS